MEQVTKARRVSRSNITKTCNKIETELKKDEPNRFQILALREDLIRFVDTIAAQDQKILDSLFNSNATEEEQDREAEECEAYRSRVTFILVMVGEYTKAMTDDHSEHRSVYTTVRESAEKPKRTYKLPKIEIKKFNGEILEWLSFWSQFEKIHQDKDLHDSDKFQYLAQAMVEGSRAKELVDSYPQTSDNYPKVIAALTDRFGKPKILKQVYVRELIKMIANNIRNKDRVGLSKLFDSLESHLRALESLGVTGEQTSEFLFPMVESILPEDILIAWQRSPNFGRSTLDPPKSELDFLMQFLQQEVESEEQRSLARTGFSPIYQKQEDNRSVKKVQSKVATAANLFIGENAVKCIFCDKPHLSQECMKAMAMSLKEKKELLGQKKACYKCLKIHRGFGCKTFVKCSGCFKPHFHLLCPDSPKNRSNEQTPSTSNNCNAVVESSKFSKDKQVLLKTIMVRIKSKNGYLKLRLLFDDGSQQSYIKTSIAIIANCAEKGSYFERNTLFGGIKTGIEERRIYQVKMESLSGNVKHTMEIPDKQKITGEIPKLPPGPWMDELKLKGIFINDMESSGEDIDVLIGADLATHLILDESITLQCGLRAVKTVFGWTIMGPIQAQTSLVISHSLTLVSNQINEMSIQGLWDLELMGIRDPAMLKTQEEKNAEVQMFFNETLHRNKDGRYIIALPWVDGHQQIPNNFEIARKRLINSTRKLNKDSKFEDYDKIFKQWQDEGIIEEVKISGELASAVGHFIPHHAVFKPESKTTPVRPVFDASCKTNRFPSLNECLMKGPNLIEMIPKAVFNFRQGKIGVISDIRKAFLMIEIQETDQKYLMFLWWEDESCTNLKAFVHKRVVFGINCSPFILAAVLNHHLDNVNTTDKQMAQKLKKSLYVDNSVTSVNSWKEYEKFKADCTRILADAKMELRQWEHTEIDNGDTELCSSVLGLKWNRKEDTLSCSSLPSIPDKLTKRTLLAAINKVFDPLGFLSPAMVSPKLVLQSTWDKGIDWDEELPKEMFIQYQKWCKELNYLQEIKIPRHMYGAQYCKQTSEVQLHIFNDASQLAYATAIFVRIQTNDEVNVQLVQAKARITPIQKMTMTRLELMGCLIGVRLAKPILESFETTVTRFYWSDSTTALAWIKRNDEWGTFVGNRVKEIINETEVCNWFHVPGKDNPADLPSRGCSPKELLKSRWWEGPDWLRLHQQQWPNVEFTVDEEKVNAEKKKSSVKNPVSSMSIQITGDPWYAKRQSYIQNLRILAWIQRFKENCLAKKKNKPRRSGTLSMKEVFNSELLMIGLIQRETFPKDSNFIDGLRVDKNKENNLYFVLTKIMNRQDTGRFKQPLLLPHSHPVVDKIIEEEHKRYGHAGVQFLVAKLREKFWIVKTRLAVKRITSKCVVCKRFNQQPATVPISPLPENRVKDAKAFEVSGIDLAGPLFLKNGSKVWIVIFTCGVYRAAHMETVDSINTEEFILAVSRFISRRGRVAVIYTDNGTNFVKAARLFGKLDWNKIQATFHVHRIQWIFIPPASPWWGGFWERLIRSLKEYLRKILGQSKLNKVQLDTTLAFVESLLNNRPLTYVSEDQDDLTPLTPAAFIQDISQTEFPEFKVLKDHEFRQKYKDLVTLKEELRSRFRSEYLGQLVQRSKPVDNIQLDVGDMVFVVDDKRKRLEWSLAKILEVFPGKDQNSRVARIQTANGELTRSFQRLVPLEVKSSETQFFDKPEAIKRAKLQKQDTSRPIKFKKSAIIRDEKEIITKSGRKVKVPLRFRFN
ncbi:uncharacterized protein LOC119075084 [Bradysia coprophila]|uniref:uncharacterized protein LOC119075084 n=1 Tax=Bradysia coprophila TaxID=38358 RepID=UPI00187DCC2B|nr:uncharacterized protein LOC119075084 [Bradysia coprophila]